MASGAWGRQERHCGEQRRVRFLPLGVSRELGARELGVEGVGTGRRWLGEQAKRRERPARRPRKTGNACADPGDGVVLMIWKAGTLQESELGICGGTHQKALKDRLSLALIW